MQTGQRVVAAESHRGDLLSSVDEKMAHGLKTGFGGRLELFVDFAYIIGTTFHFARGGDRIIRHGLFVFASATSRFLRNRGRDHRGVGGVV